MDLAFDDGGVVTGSSPRAPASSPQWAQIRPPRAAPPPPSLAVMDLAFDDGGVGAGLDLKAGDAVVVDIVALEIAHAVVEGEDADVAAVMNVVATHDRVRVILHPHSRQRIATYLVVFVGTLAARG